MRTVFQNLLLVLVSVVACLGLAELAVRLLVSPPALPDSAAATAGVQKIVVFDDKLESRYRPGSKAVIRSQYGEFEVVYEINEAGLRDRPLVDAQGAGTKRILVLGNSLAEGWGVPAEKTFVRVTEERLAGNRAGQPPVRMVNAGISGYGAAQTYLLFGDLRKKIQPAAVVFVYVSSMVHFDHIYLSRAERDGAGLATGLSVDWILKGGSPGAGAQAGEALPSHLRSLAEHSALARLAALSLIARRERARIVAGDPATDLLAGMRAAPGMLAELHEPSLRHVAAIAAAARASGTPFILVHLPLAHQVSARAWGKGRTAYGLEEKVYDAPDRAVVENYCRSAGIACVFAHDALRRAAEQRPASGLLFYDYDFHPNEAGNAAIGEWLAERLSQSLPRSH